MQEYDRMIVWSKDFTEEQKTEWQSFFRRQAEEKTRLCVIYHPSCGCKLDQFVILDRFPMSEKIISTCPACEKGCYMEISDPIMFHLPLTNQDYSLDDLKGMVVTDGPQKYLIEEYKKIAERPYSSKMAVKYDY